MSFFLGHSIQARCNGLGECEAMRQCNLRWESRRSQEIAKQKLLRDQPELAPSPIPAISQRSRRVSDHNSFSWSCELNESWKSLRWESCFYFVLFRMVRDGPNRFSIYSWSLVNSSWCQNFLAIRNDFAWRLIYVQKPMYSTSEHRNCSNKFKEHIKVLNQTETGTWKFLKTPWGCRGCLVEPFPLSKNTCAV